MTNRRKFLIGVGSLTAGSAAAIATGAAPNTLVAKDRPMNINVVADDVGILEFIDRGEYVEIDDEGRATIDFSLGKGSGINVDSEFEIPSSTENKYRSYDSPTNGDWFAVGNAGQTDYWGLRYTFEAGPDYQATGSGTFFKFAAGSTDGGQDELKAGGGLSPGDTKTMVVKGFDVGVEHQFGMLVSTMGASTDDNLSGKLSIETLNGDPTS